MKTSKPVASYARMWPRELFNCKTGKKLLVKEIDILSESGVYVLYCEDRPYYVGKANKLRTRLWNHANKAGGRYYNFWNYFSVFVVKDPVLRNQLEGVLIAAMPTANGARPRIPRSQLPAEIRKILHQLTNKPVQIGTKSAAAGR